MAHPVRGHISAWCSKESPDLPSRVFQCYNKVKMQLLKGIYNDNDLKEQYYRSHSILMKLGSNDNNVVYWFEVTNIDCKLLIANKPQIGDLLLARTH